MNDFIKIFLVLCGLVGSFLFGRNYGEKSHSETEEYRQLVKTNEELNFAKNELENVKAKLQNIADTAANKKTDELLSQILHVFLTDLGLRIQNRELILKQAAELKTEKTPVVAAVEKKPVDLIEKPKAPEKSSWTRSSVNKFKSFEWMVTNSAGNQGTLRDLKKVQIRNLASFLKEADYLDQSECENFYGSYKGSVKDINNKYFGSLEFELKASQVNAKEEIFGKIAWYNNDSAFSEKIRNNCGKKIEGLNSRIFTISADKYVQLYKLSNMDKTAGNFYEVLPNGTTKIIGSFVLNRVDKF